MIRSFRCAAVVACAVTTLSAQEQPLRTIREGILDRIELFVDRPPTPGTSVVVVKPFTTEGTNLGAASTGTANDQSARRVRAEVPLDLTDGFFKGLSSLGGFKGILREGEGDLIVEGNFTDLKPGSLPKGGLLKGERSVVAVAGTVRDGSGKLLAKFEQRRMSVMTALGADSERKMQQDARNLGQDLAKFVHAWLNGKALD
jgi:hypothetical protein